MLQEEMGHSDDSSSASDAVKARLGEIYHQDEGMVVTDIPMERGQSLRIELTLVCGEESHVIHKGETFYLSGKNRHYLKNEKKTTAKVIWVSTPPLF